MKKNFVIGIFIIFIATTFIIAWAPWLTEEYGKEKIINYFSKEYNFSKDNIRINTIEKKPFEMHFGLAFLPLNDTQRTSYAHAWVTFYGEVKHEQFIGLLKS